MVYILDDVENQKIEKEFLRFILLETILNERNQITNRRPFSSIVHNTISHKNIDPQHNAGDVELLAQIGYKQELNRHYSTLQVFGIAFSIMGLLPSIASVSTGFGIWVQLVWYGVGFVFNLYPLHWYKSCISWKCHPHLWRVILLHELLLP